MISHMLNVGTTGTLEIRDNTDSDINTVELWMSSSSAVDIEAIPWYSVIDGIQADVQSFNLAASTSPQLVATIFVGSTASSFVWHVDDTMTAELDGPTDFEIVLYRASVLKTVFVKIGGVWKQAVPYVRVGGIWKTATPFVKIGGVWKST